jgi:Zn-dependent protease
VRYRPTLYLGRWSGVDIRLDLLVVFLIAVLFFTSVSDARSQDASPGEIWSAVAHLALLVAMLLCMFLHELGHALACRLRGHEPTMILLSFVGLTFFKTGKVKPKDELLIALAGPAVNLSIAVLTSPFIFLAMADSPPPMFSQASMATLYGFLAWLSVLNFAVAFINLLPGWPADGARAMRAHLARKYGYGAGTVRAVAISHGFWLILAGVSVIVMALAPAISLLASHPRTHSPAAMIVMYNLLVLVFAVLGIFYGWSEKRRVARLGAERAAQVVGPPPEFMPSYKPPADEQDPDETDAQTDAPKARRTTTVVAGKAMWKAAKATGKGTGWVVRKSAKAVGTMVAGPKEEKKE